MMIMEMTDMKRIKVAIPPQLIAYPGEHEYRISSAALKMLYNLHNLLVSSNVCSR